MASDPLIADFYIRCISVAARPIMMVFVGLIAKSLETIQKWEEGAKCCEQTFASYSGNTEPAPQVLLVMKLNL